MDRGQRGRPAPRRPRAREREASSASASTTRRSRASDCRTPPTRSTASTAARPSSTPPPTSATSATTAARPAVPPGRLSTWPPGRSSSTVSSAPPFDLVTNEGTRRVELELPGLYNVYNAVAAASLALALGAGLDDVVAGLGRFRPAFGRFERIRAGGKVILMLLIKNPAGANEAVRTLVAGGAPPVAVVALNDDIADGRDVSWIWDVDFEPLLPALDRLVASGEPGGGAGAPLQVRRLRRGADRGRARARAGARPRPRTDARRCGARRAADVHRDAGATRRRGAPGARPAVLGHGSRVRRPGARGGLMSVPQTAEVVVVGGGIMGASALYHLARAGLPRRRARRARDARVRVDEQGGRRDPGPVLGRAERRRSRSSASAASSASPRSRAGRSTSSSGAISSC